MSETDQPTSSSYEQGNGSPADGGQREAFLSQHSPLTDPRSAPDTGSAQDSGETKVQQPPAESRSRGNVVGPGSAIGPPPVARQPNVHPSVEAEQEREGPPAHLGTRWREIEADQLRDAWIDLRRWVDWLVVEYRLKETVVPPCWYKHPDITAELYAARNMEYKVWEDGGPAVQPMMMWHTNLAQMKYRLREAVEQTGCAAKGYHVEPVSQKQGLEPFEREYDESDWETHIHTATERFSTRRPEHPANASADQTQVMGLRATIDPVPGGIGAVSDPVAVRSKAVAPGEVLQLRKSSLADPQEPEFQLRYTHTENIEEVVFEVSHDGQNWKAVDEQSGEDPTAASAEVDQQE